MFQSFESAASPEQGPARLENLRAIMAAEGLAGYLVPRADVHQGEYVAARDDRLSWLTGFTGSAGFAVVLRDKAGVFIDGRYRVQVKAQVDLGHFTPVAWPEIQAGDWIRDNLSEGLLGFDPWLHTTDEITKIETALAGTGVSLVPVMNLIDAIWPDQPEAPMGRVFLHPDHLAGKSAVQKCTELAAEMQARGEKTTVITLPDSICWLLNIRGADVPKNPVMQGFALLHDDASVDLFAAAGKFTDDVLAALPASVRLHAPDAFNTALSSLTGRVRVDRGQAPLAVALELNGPEVELVWGDDPCRLPKACKNAAEIAATREAHLRDGAAVTEFLAWLDAQLQGSLTEIAVVKALEDFRRATNVLHDISFDTICGAGPNGAIIHYRVTHDTDRPVTSGELLLVDSGAQYFDGTTDITRTIAIGDVQGEERDCYTRVLRGMIAISRARFPKGVAGRDIDALARAPLWAAGQDYDHGTGHGVGAFLSVHEGPQRISRVSEVLLQAGMILSNEPGYYREGAFGIRLENLIVVQDAPALGDNRAQFSFETLTFVPFDRRLVVVEDLSRDERAWWNAYHAQVLEKLAPRLSPSALAWAEKACAPL